MNRNKSSFLLLAATVLMSGLTLGCSANWSAAAQTQPRPKIFALGTELIERPLGPNGVPFNLTSTFAFTSDYFLCAVLTNDQPFAMPTHSMGTAQIGKNQLFMSVDSVSIDSVRRLDAGGVELKGMGRSITRVGDKFEEAIVPFTAVAVDGGPGYEKDSLVLTVTYNDRTSPMQFAIYGPEARFGQRILSGDITIAPNQGPPAPSRRRSQAR